MAHVLITGSADGLGLMAGRLLIGQGHAVTPHARDTARAAHVRAVLPAAEKALVGDLGSLDGIRPVAAQADAAGRFDAVIFGDPVAMLVLGAGPADVETVLVAGNSPNGTAPWSGPTRPRRAT